mgnify:CR=1 FL=1
MEVLSSVSQSYLTQLWSNDVFKKGKPSSFKTLTDKISKNFTIVVLVIAFLSTFFWLFYDASKALNVFTAGDSSNDLVIKGIKKVEALKIKEFINQQINA